ncbi:MAG: GCN5-related N-acetyltransferase [Acidimicrobiales bacterium]|nr:GCN5-related N-acetyltransferase [Acidimicrobiales bacterium]
MAEPVPPGVVVRRAGQADLPAIVAVIEAAAREGRWIGKELPIDHDAQAIAVSAGMADAASAWLVVEREGEVVGYGGVHDEGHGHGSLFMALADGHRGQGLGTALLDAALCAAREGGHFHKVVLQVWPHNVAALALYRKFGFSVEGYRHRHWRRANGELWDVIEMGLALED